MSLLRSWSNSNKSFDDALNTEIANVNQDIPLESGAYIKAEEKFKIKVSDCESEAVCVFSDRAQVTRLVIFEAQKKSSEKKNDSFSGTTLLTITDLPSSFEDSSVRIAKTEGNATILEIFIENATVETFHEDDEKKENHETIEETKEMKEEKNALKLKKIQELVDKQGHLKEELQRLNKEKEWLEAYALQQNSCQSKIDLTIEQAMEFLTFYTANQERFDQKRSTILEIIEQIEKERASLIQTKSVKSVHILLGNAEGPQTFALSYVVKSASWKPSYDIRVKTSASDLDSVELGYFGVITNSSGDAWNDVILSLSTAKPHIGGSPPQVKTIYVSFVNNNNNFNNFLVRDMEMSKSSSIRKKEKRTKRGPITTEVQQNQTSTTFKIPRLATIPSDSLPRKVSINVVPLKSKYSYVLVPKESLHAYLRSETCNETNFPFLAGKASVFMNDNFVANSDLKAANPGEEMTLYLGADPTVVVEFKEQTFRETAGLISKTLKTRYQHEITVKNTKNKGINCTIFDELPKSQADDIKVVLLKPTIQEKETDGEATLNNLNNLKWTKLINSGETFAINFEYQIEQGAQVTIDFYSS